MFRGIRSLVKSAVKTANKQFLSNKYISVRTFNNHNDIEDALDESTYKELADQYFSVTKDHSCFIIHPYIKWGPQKVRDSNPENQIKEAEALIRTLSPWKVRDTLKVSLETLDKRTIFGKGNMEKLKRQIRSDPMITAVFINVSTLKNMQIEELQLQFGVPIFDRYRIIMQILRMHATSKHAKLQVALAEIPYLRTRLFKEDSALTSKDFETRKLMLQEREQKIKNAIKKLREHRELLRKKRRTLDFPTVAVVGYTNCGKTSLIKALTGEKNLQPKNQLFATLDVTMHGCVLPSKLEVLLVDTVGFISNIPTNLIECFVATLEDAIYSDVILHVEDLSNEDRNYQRNHVISTLENLSKQTDVGNICDKVITVGNKSDIVQNNQQNEEMLYVSAKKGTGLEVLRHLLERAVLKNTNRVQMTIRVPSGGEEMRWLYKNSAVTSVVNDKKDSQFENLKVIITQVKLQQFKHIFVNR